MLFTSCFLLIENQDAILKPHVSSDTVKEVYGGVDCDETSGERPDDSRRILKERSLTSRKEHKPSYCCTNFQWHRIMCLDASLSQIEPIRILPGHVYYAN
jgi:hypothetical protein